MVSYKALNTSIKDYFLHNNGIPCSFHKLQDVMEKR